MNYVKNSLKSVILNYACVSNDYKEEFMQGDFNTK